MNVPQTRPETATNRQKVQEKHKSAEKGTLHVVDVGNGGQGVHRGDLLGVGGLLRAQYPEDGRALRVANVVELLVARLAQDVVDVGRQVVFAHLVEGEIPEFLVVAVQAGVVL